MLKKLAKFSGALLLIISFLVPTVASAAEARLVYLDPQQTYVESPIYRLVVTCSSQAFWREGYYRLNYGTMYQRDSTTWHTKSITISENNGNVIFRGDFTTAGMRDTANEVHIQ